MLTLKLNKERGWQFFEEFAPHPGEAKDNDVHACKPNYITMQNQITAKMLPVYKFTTLKTFVTLSFNGWVVFFLIIIYFALQYTDRFVGHDGHDCRLSLLSEVRIPHTTPAQAYSVVVTKGAQQFSLKSK